MGHKDHRAPFFCQGLDDLDHLLLQLGIKGRSRLVEQQRARFHAQGAGDGGALLLAAGQHGGPGIGLVGNTDLVQQGAGAGFDDCRVLAQDRDGGLHHVLQDGHMGPEVELLKHHRQIGADADHLGPVRRVAVKTAAFPMDGFAFKDHVPLLAVLQQVAAAQKGRLPGPGRADQRHNMSARSHQIDALEDLDRTIAFVQVADFDDGRGGCHWGIRGHGCSFALGRGSSTQFGLYCNVDCADTAMSRAARLFSAAIWSGDGGVGTER